MKIIENVKATVKPEDIVIDEYSVWMASNINEISVPDENGEARTEYEYTETRYTKDEYIRLIGKENERLEEKITDTQLALCDVYELIGG